MGVINHILVSWVINGSVKIKMVLTVVNALVPAQKVPLWPQHCVRYIDKDLERLSKFILCRLPFHARNYVYIYELKSQHG